MEFTEEHKVAEQHFNSRKNIFITGAAGTGKTTLINHLLKKRNHVLVCATTGVAALLYENGATIHSALKIPINFPTKEELIKYYSSIQNKKSRFNPKYAWVFNIEKIDTILIEELSMCSAYLMMCIDIALRTLRNIDRPFGGVQFVGVGDFMQLEPVYDVKQVFFDKKTKTQRGPPPEQGEMAFTSETWHQLNIHTIYLTQIFRQKDIQFQSLLYKIRMNQSLDKHEILARNNKPKPSSSDPCIFIMHERKQVRDFNLTQQASLGDDVKTVTYSFPYSSICNADEDEYTNLVKQTRDALQLQYNQDNYQFKVGDKVMIIRNNEYQRVDSHDDEKKTTKLVNGDVGFIKDFTSDNYPIVQIHRNNALYSEVIVSPIEYKRTRFERDEEVVLANLSIIPLILAWAITVHKCQGITIHELPVVINCKNLNWVPNAFYVAFSRATSIDQVFLENFNGFKQSQMGIQFYKQSNKRKHDEFIDDDH